MGLLNRANSLSLGATSCKKKKKKQIVIAGCGGIGSNVARFLVQAGFTNLHLIDFDKVVLSNLNRQFYRISQKGEKKARMLKDNLLQLLSFSQRRKAHISFKVKRLTPKNVQKQLANASFLVEAFDTKEAKQMLLESASLYYPHLPIVSANGIAGSDCSTIKVVRLTPFITVVGDFTTDVNSNALYGYKVSCVASLMTQQIVSKQEVL